jgi:hypothetical protein
VGFWLPALWQNDRTSKPTQQFQMKTISTPDFIIIRTGLLFSVGCFGSATSKLHLSSCGCCGNGRHPAHDVYHSCGDRHLHHFDLAWNRECFRSGGIDYRLPAS